MRGFGSFHAAIGIGPYSNALVQAIRRSPGNEKEIFSAEGVRCPVAYRDAVDPASLLVGAERVGSEVQQASLSGALKEDHENHEGFALYDTRPGP